MNVYVTPVGDEHPVTGVKSKDIYVSAVSLKRQHQRSGEPESTWCRIPCPQRFERPDAGDEWSTQEKKRRRNCVRQEPHQLRTHGKWPNVKREP